jgi:actin related protein 2/3 complex subunit 2
VSLKMPGFADLRGCVRRRCTHANRRPSCDRPPPRLTAPPLAALPAAPRATPARHRSIGVEDHLRTVYGAMLAAPYEDADVTVVADRRALDGSPADVALRIALLRRHVLAWPFLRYMAAVTAGRGASEAPFVLRSCPSQPLYFLPRVDRVTLIFHLRFTEATDRAIARVVAQELTEANRQVNNAPPCSWSERVPPMELRSLPKGAVPDVAGDDASIGFLTFSIFPNAGGAKSPAQRDALATQFSLFRPFLAYHIKAAKSYLHARLRNRSDGLQKVLNRAIPEDPFAERGMKLASGKTFVRK